MVLTHSDVESDKEALKNLRLTTTNFRNRIRNYQEVCKRLQYFVELLKVVPGELLLCNMNIICRWNDRLFLVKTAISLFSHSLLHQMIRVSFQRALRVALSKMMYLHFRHLGKNIYIPLFEVRVSIQHFYSWRAHPMIFTTTDYTKTRTHQIQLELKYPTMKSKIKIPNI